MPITCITTRNKSPLSTFAACCLPPALPRDTPTPGPTKPFFPLDTIQMLCHQSHFPEPQHILTGFLLAVCLPSSGL